MHTGLHSDGPSKTCADRQHGGGERKEGTRTLAHAPGGSVVAAFVWRLHAPGGESVKCPTRLLVVELSSYKEPDNVSDASSLRTPLTHPIGRVCFVHTLQ